MMGKQLSGGRQICKRSSSIPIATSNLPGGGSGISLQMLVMYLSIDNCNEVISGMILRATMTDK